MGWCVDCPEVLIVTVVVVFELVVVEVGLWLWSDVTVVVTAGG